MLDATTLLGRDFDVILDSAFDPDSDLPFARDRERAENEAVEQFLEARSHAVLGSGPYRLLAVYALTPVFATCPDVETADRLLVDIRDGLAAIGTKAAMTDLGIALENAEGALDEAREIHDRHVSMGAANPDMEGVSDAEQALAAAETAATIRLDCAGRRIDVVLVGSRICTVIGQDSQGRSITPTIFGSIDLSDDGASDARGWKPRIVA